MKGPAVRWLFIVRGCAGFFSNTFPSRCPLTYLIRLSRARTHSLIAASLYSSLELSSPRMMSMSIAARQAASCLARSLKCKSSCAWMERTHVGLFAARDERLLRAAFDCIERRRGLLVVVLVRLRAFLRPPRGRSGRGRAGARTWRRSLAGGVEDLEPRLRGQVRHSAPSRGCAPREPAQADDAALVTRGRVRGGCACQQRRCLAAAPPLALICVADEEDDEDEPRSEANSPALLECARPLGRWMVGGWVTGSSVSAPARLLKCY